MYYPGWLECSCQCKNLLCGNVLIMLRYFVSFPVVSRIYLGLTVVIVHLVADVFYTPLNTCGTGSLVVGCSAVPLMQDHVELMCLPAFAVLQSRFKNSKGCVLR